MAKARYTAEQIKAMLKEVKDMSLKDAANHLKVSVGTIHRWKGGAKAVKKTEAKKNERPKSSKKVESLFKVIDKNLAALRKAVA